MLNVQTIRQYINRFMENERYSQADRAITSLVQTYPSNIDFTSVLLKVTVINKLYSTNIMSTFDVARHIVSLNIEANILDGDMHVINLIRRINIANHHRDIYAFATKYCNWHNFNSYPIYDTFVAKSLRHFDVVQGNLRVYDNLKLAIDTFKQQNQLEQFNYKEIDKFLWQHGKEL